VSREKRSKKAGDRAGASEGVSAPRFKSGELFNGHTRVFIEHEGSDYLLSLTRQGKLILTK
jgi:hemin uptake protein HemP